MREENIHAVSKMQNYIEKHLQSPITLKELANVSGYSPFHAAKLFKEATTISPFEYIRKRRLTIAAQHLRDTHTQVIDVALDFVFDSHEGFTRAFSKEFGINPKQYHLHARPLKWFLPYNVAHHFNYLKKKEGSESMEKTILPIFTQIIERPKRKAIILRGKTATHYFDYCDEVGCDIWGTLVSIKEALYEPVGMWLPEKLRTPGTSLYVQGVEVPEDYQGNIPEDCELIDLNPMTYLIMQGPSYDDEQFTEHVGAAMQAFKSFNPEPYGYAFSYDQAPKCQLEPQGYRGYIELHPVKSLK